MTSNSTSQIPISNIALCLSGGGYRAAAFHLGMMTLLSEVSLLDQARYFSTASGGTITAMKYIVSKINGTSFQEFSNELSFFLHDTNIVSKAFEKLGTIPTHLGKSDISLIRSAAGVYRQDLIKKITPNGKTREWTIKDLKDSITKEKIFEDLIFNSTEFRTGSGFRFRAVMNQKILFGNQHATIREELSSQISLADIIAASACFPGVFEPMQFPEDFLLENSSKPWKPFSNKDEKLETIALMDGGIFDNQGMHGMTLSSLN